MSYEVKDFEGQVTDRSRQVPVLVDFWAPWCGPCRTLGPVLERLAAQADGRWELVKVNVDEHQDLAAAFNISSIPAVKLFVNGEAVDEFVGALPEREIRRFLEKALPSPSAGQLAEAERLLKEGRNGAAAELLESLVAREPGNLAARTLLAQALLTTAPERIPALLEPVGPESELADKAGALRTLGRLAHLARQPAALPEARVRERYLAGAAAVRSGDFESALPAFIDVLERDKAYDNAGAKEACKAIFQLLGTQHPLVQRFFRAFSSALHA
jgi:putative thioredoxin